MNPFGSFTKREKKIKLKINPIKIISKHIKNIRKFLKLKKNPKRPKINIQLEKKKKIG